MKKILAVILLSLLALSCLSGCGDKSAKIFTVAFDSCGGGNIDSQSVLDGSLAVAPEVPIKDGYTFIGWYSGDLKYDFASPITKDLVLKAKWAENTPPLATYTVSFDSCGGSDVAPQTVESGNKAVIPEAPTKSGFIFAGWYNGAIAYDFDSAVVENIILQANWTSETPPPSNYTVTFNTGKGSGVAPQIITEGDSVIKPEDPVLEGATFGGWYVGDEEYDFGSSVTSNFTISAKWIKDAYVFIFDSGEGSAVDAQTVAHGESAVKPEDPTMEGFIFAGWYLGDSEYDFDSAVTEDITVKAKWEAVASDITPEE